MRKITLLYLLLGFSMLTQAQEETKYYLPRTVVKLTLLIEKTTYTPGEFNQYSERFLKMSQGSEPVNSYRILSTQMRTEGMADPDKEYIAKTDPKRNIQAVNLADDGVLLSINTEPRKTEKPTHFVAAPKPATLNSRDFMNQEILSAGSKAKMAELTAQEIYDIRESKIMLAKGQADYMPKDGEQLRIMLKQLNTQEAALLQLFEGTTICDTLEHEITLIPREAIERQLLFRFSKHFGMTDLDDLSGEPYYLTVEDLKTTPTIQVAAEPGKKDKNGEAIYVNLPGKIRLTIQNSGQTLLSDEIYAAQFGHIEMLDGNLFSKKLQTSIVLNPATGNLESIKTDVLK